ncbi:hypothetical protein ACP4OV_014815 [Aristida adscensionis]
MKVTTEMLLLALESLPPPPDATIVLTDGGAGGSQGGGGGGGGAPAAGVPGVGVGGGGAAGAGAGRPGVGGGGAAGAGAGRPGVGGGGAAGAGAARPGVGGGGAAGAGAGRPGVGGGGAAGESCGGAASTGGTRVGGGGGGATAAGVGGPGVGGSVGGAASTGDPRVGGEGGGSRGVGGKADGTAAAGGGPGGGGGGKAGGAATTGCGVGGGQSGRMAPVCGTGGGGRGGFDPAVGDRAGATDAGGDGADEAVNAGATSVRGSDAESASGGGVAAQGLHAVGAGGGHADAAAGNYTNQELQEPQQDFSHYRYNQSMDLYLFARPVSSFWEQYWMNKPLVLHDKELVLASQYIGKSEVGGTVDLSSEITDVLSNHPGPVRHFRLDTSFWTEKNLADWLKTLSLKRVEEVVVISMTKSGDEVFPTEQLQSSSLKVLTIAFMKIPRLDMLEFEYTSLRTLQLIGCTCDSRKLSYVISDCHNLQELSIGFFTEPLSIISDSLVHVQIWQSEAGWLSVKSSPKLQCITTGIRPKEGYSSVTIGISDAPDLRSISFLMLPFHQLTINGKSPSKDYMSLTSLQEIKIGLNMGDYNQKLGLRKVIECMPNLADLYIWRMDEITFDEELGSPFVGLNTVHCVKSCLEILMVDGFRGGLAEMDLICSVVRHASRLQLLQIERHPMGDDRTITEAIDEIRSCERASEACRLTVL